MTATAAQSRWIQSPVRGYLRVAKLLSVRPQAIEAWASGIGSGAVDPMPLLAAKGYEHMPAGEERPAAGKTIPRYDNEWTEAGFADPRLTDHNGRVVA